ncbi:MAG: ImmA/IrrE family metallo-endopeptidase [Pseudonocardiaceae bacterium]
MTTTTNDAIPAPSVRTLAGLRAVAHESSQSTTSLLYAADCQAWLLRTMLPIPATRIPAHLSTFIPSIRVDYIDNMPIPGTAFWGNGHWHIHVRTGDPDETQVFTVLHELKHIIDHPLRRQPHSLSNTDWEEIADYFANRVLVPEPSQVPAARERRNSL